jgi:hypothetical protein
MGYLCDACGTYIQFKPRDGFCPKCGSKTTFTEGEPPEVCESDAHVDAATDECMCGAPALYINGTPVASLTVDEPIVLGRKTDAEDIRTFLEFFPTVSSRHAEVVWRGEGKITVKDLGSTNGTLVNGRQINRVGYEEEFSLPVQISLGKTGVAIVEVKYE